MIKIHLNSVCISYITALLLIAVMVIWSSLLVEEGIALHESDARIVNLSGSQRMLTGKIRWLTLELMVSNDEQEQAGLQQDLLNTVQRMQSAHQELSGSSVAQSPVVNSLFFGTSRSLDYKVREYLAAAKSLAAAPAADLAWDNIHSQTIRLNSMDLMHDLDALVMQFQIESEQRGSEIQFMTHISHAAGLLVLLMVGFCVFRPMEKRLIREQEYLEDLNKTLDERVSERTMQLEKRTSELEHSETKFQTVVESIPEGLMVVNDRGKIEIVNQRLEEMTGYSSEDLIGQPLETLIPERFAHHKTYRNDYLAKPSVRPMGKGLELFVQRKDGSEFPVDISLSPLEMGQEKAVIATIHDITQHKQVEQALKVAKQAAEAANNAKNRFLSTMSHELYTPLNHIIGFSELLYEQAEKQHRHQDMADLDTVLTSAKHLLTMVDDILTLTETGAGAGAGNLEPVTTTIDVAKMVQDVADSMQGLMEQNRNSFIVDCNKAVGILHANETGVRKCLLHLLGNAGKFTEAGQVNLTVSKEQLDDVEWVCFQVRDTGIGISNEQMKYVFEKFTQGDSSTTRQYDGIGMGLVITQQLCQSMGGEISVNSVLGQGSIFTLRFPAMPCTAMDVASEQVVEQTDMTKPNLVVMQKLNLMEWTDDMSVGVSVIDRDHQKLFSLLNEMEYIFRVDVASKKAAIQSVLSELIDYTKYHFKREEILMEACGYPELENHKQVHAVLKEQVKHYLEGYRRDPSSFDLEKLRNFLKDWLIDHIMVMDKRYESWMQNKEDIIGKTNTEFEQRIMAV